MASIDLEYNSGFQIYNSDGTPFHDLVLHKCTYETVVMSLGDKISGILYYKDNALDVTMSEYIIYKGVRYTLVNPPTILREGLVSDNSELRGMTKYSFTFYHPMYVLNNFPFSDIAVQSGQSRYLSQNKTFSWIGTLVDFVAKLNKNLEDTQWMVTIGNVTQEEQTKLSEVLSFDKNTIAEALKRGYETWEVPYVVDQLTTSSPYYPEKQFVVQYGLPTTEILDEYNQPFVFQMGQGVGLKNNSRNPKNNKIITRIAGYGSEDNIPYGYPQIPYYGGNVQYPLYYGIVGGQRVQLIKHPFTRNHLMPSVYSQSVYNKVNPKLPNGSNNPNYDPTIELVDYYDANDNTYTNRIKPNSPSYEIHEFGDIKPELGEKSIISAVPVSQQETQPDYKQKSDFLQEILDRISATEIEDEKTELLDVYDRVDAGLSYYEKHGEEGGDTYWYVFSITRDDYYEYVSYESSNYNFTGTMLRDGSSAPTPDWDDTMDDDGNYLQSYFKITLPILEFDLYACAAITQEMKINMRSGACIGCTFPVEVDWDDYKRNFYNSDGEFDPDGEQRDYIKYPDSSSGQITVMVKKELETFGTLMPNQYQQPTTGDKFVILGISLPNTYITSAEQRLDTDMKQYMRDNNVYYYDYPLKFDEHFLISHEDILSQMKNNVVVRFNYAGTEHALYIKQMSVKYNESPLPKYDITLTDDIEIVLNKIGQVTDEVSKLRLGFGAGGFGTVGAEYIRKDIDDTARGTIRMIKGMQVGERFVTGLLGEGGVFRKDSDGTTYLETDKLYVRMKAYFDTVEVKHYLHTGGNRIASQASGIVCSRVEMIDAYGGLAMDVADAVLFRCFFKANDGDKTIRNDFKIGDLAFCHETNVDVSEINMHGYWRLVIGRNENGFLTENKEAWIDLSNRASETLTIDGEQYVCNGYQNGSDAPIAQDDIIQLGNIANKDRQGAIVEYVGGDDAPSYQIFQGIGEDLPYPYTLEDKNYIGLGYSSQTGHAYMNVYGDVFIGAKPDAVTGESPTYIKYVQEDPETGEPKLTIKAVMEIIPTSTIGGETLEEYIQEHQTIYDDTDVLNAISDLENITDNLQDQIDGAIETLYGDVDPSIPANDPYRNYTTEEKENHLGDMYYNSTTGYAYRYDKKVEDNVTTYFWQLIRDSGITEAIARAGEAVNLANTKGKIFTTADGVLPTPPYNVNDLWVSAKGTWGNITYDNDILKCVTARALNATSSINDWVKASKYTDDSSLQNFISFTYDPENAQLHKQIDGKIDTFFTEATQDPSSNWTTTALKEDHVDDVWYQTDTDRMFRYIKVENGGVTTYRWDEIYDELAKQAYRHAAIAQDTADGKRRVFVSQPQDSDAYDVGDLWVNASYTSGNEIIYDNDVLRCKEGKAAGDTFSISHWQKASKYTDDTDFNTFVQNTYSSDQANLQNQIDGKYETWFLNGVPTLNNAPANEWTTIALKDEHLGDLYWDKTHSHAYRFVKNNLTYSWLQIGDNGVICAMADAANAQDTADKKRRVFLSEPTPPYDQGDLWTQGGSGDIMMCVTSRSSGSYNAADWAKASKYTNDALLLTFLDGYQGNLTAITNQVDAKLDTWVSSSDPSVRWTSNDLKDLHVGDIWLNTSDSTVSGVDSMKSAVYTKNGSAYSWVEDNTIPNSVFDTIDGKRSIYVTWRAWRNGNVNNLKERDLFIPSSDTTQGGVDYKANKVYRCTSASQETFQEIDYTDDTKVNAIIAKYGQIMNIQGATANDIGEALGHLREVLGGSTTVDGGLVLTNAIYMKDTAATPSIWAGISGVYKTDETGTGYKGHGTASWYGGGVSNGIPIDHEVSPSALNYAKSLFRFDGSGYLAGGNITWDATGAVTIKNITTLSDSQNTNLLNELATFNSAFSFATSGSGSTTVLSITPNVPFTSLSILDTSVSPNVGRPVATQKWVSDNYISIAFFNRLFQAYSSTTISDANKVAANDTTTTINNLKLLVGTWTNEYLSALGLNSQQGGGSGGGGDVYWSQLTTGTGGQDISASLLHNVTKTLSIYYDESPAAITYNGRSVQSTPVLITKTYADGRYYQKIANGSASEVVLADGTSSKLKTINGNSIFGDGDIVISGGGGSNDRLVSVSNPLNAQVFQIRIGQVAIGTSTGKAYAGSSSDYNLWSFPDGATAINGNNTANIQSIRYTWGTEYFRDFFMSPNNNYIFHRARVGAATDAWCIIPQYVYVKGSIGLGSATKPVYIDGAGKLVEANSYPSTLDNIADGTTRKLSDYVTISTAQTISGAKTFNNGCWIIAANENNAISSKHWSNGILYNNANNAVLATNAAIRNAIRFKWYGSYWNIGNIRGGGEETYGFGIALEDTTNNRLIDCLRVTKDGTYVQGNLVWHAGNDGAGSGLDADKLDGLQTCDNQRPWGKIASVGTDGVMEVGRYIDFHYTGDAATTDVDTDFSVRVQATARTHNTINIPSTSGTLALTSQIPTTLDNIADGTTRKLSDYLPKSGGTMTGELHAKHVFEVYNGTSSSKQSSYMKFARNGAGGNDYAALGWNGGDVRLCVLGGDGNYTSEIETLLIGYNGQLKLQAANGTAPLTTSSTTVCTNLNADMLDGEHASRFLRTDLVSIELNSTGALRGYGGFFDFHFNGSTADYTSRIIEDQSGRLNINSVIYANLGGNVGIGTGSPSQKLDVNGNIHANGRVSINTTDTSGILTVSRGSTSNYAIDTIGQQRYMDASGDTSSLVAGLFSSNKCPFIRFTNTLNTYVDLQFVPVLTDNVVTDYLFQIGYSDITTRIFSKNFRIYTAKSLEDSTQVQALQAISNGRILVGSTVQLIRDNADCRLVVEGNMCTNSTNGSFIKIGNVYLIYDSGNNAIKVAGNAAGTTAANFYSMGAVSALGANTSSGGGGSTEYVTLSTGQAISGAKTFTSNVQMSADLIPSMTNQYYVGTSGRTFLGLYVKNATISGVMEVGGLTYLCSRAFQFSASTDGGGHTLSTISTNGRSLRIELGSSALNPYVSKPWTEGSDIRRKDIIANASTSVDNVANAPVFNFRYKGDSVNSINLGTSAQYWRNVFPCGVSEMGDGYLAMNYGAIALASAVVVARRVQNHEDRIAYLERENEQLRNEIKQLKAA